MNCHMRKKESLNEVTNRWNNFRINDTRQSTHICFNGVFNLNLNFKKIKGKYEKNDNYLKASVFDVLPED